MTEIKEKEKRNFKKNKVKKMKQSKQMQKTIAEKRIIKLFNMAEKKAKEDNFELANRYVEIARKLSMRHLVKIPKKYKRKFCRHCYSYLLPSKNCRIRIYRGKVIIYCNNCKKFSRFIIKKATK